MGDYDKALVDYQQCLIFNPTFFKAANNMAIVYHNTEQFAKAIEKYEQAIQLNPEYIDCHYNLAGVLVGLRKWDEALVSVARAVELLEKQKYVEIFEVGDRQDFDEIFFP